MRQQKRETNRTLDRHPARSRYLGESALLGAARKGASHKQQDMGRASADAAFWNLLGNQLKASEYKERRVKNLFDGGVRHLVANNRNNYHPQVLERLPSARMTPVWDDRREQLGASLGRVDTFGRYISLRSLNDDVTTFHELSHRVFRLAMRKQVGEDKRTGREVHKGYIYSLYNEPIAEQMAQDVATAVGASDGKPPAYQPHRRVLEKTLQIGQTSFRELTAFASGDDPVMNYEAFRATIWERAGWDVVGFVDGSFEAALDASLSGYVAAERIDATLSRFVPPPELHH